MDRRYAGPMGIIEDLCGSEIASRVKPIWGLNEEGEIRGIWRDRGVPNLWYMLGMRMRMNEICTMRRNELNGTQEIFKCAVSIRNMSLFVCIPKSGLFVWD